MKPGSAANTGPPTRLGWTWLLVLLVLANIVVWTAWPFRGELVARGILAPPPADRVDFEPLPLPPIVEPVDVAETDADAADTDADVADTDAEVADTDATDETTVEGLPESAQNAAAESGPPPVEQTLAAAPESPAVAPQPSTTAQPAAADLLDCVVIGPLGSRQALEAAAARLRSTGARVDSNEEFDVDYLVYIAPAESLAGARAVLDELTAKSVEVAAIIWSGPYANAVSVGVYASRNRADARRDRIAGLGYDVSVRERHHLRARLVPATALGDLAGKPCPDDTAG